MTAHGVTMPAASVVVVGAGLGGWRTAVALRTAGYLGSVTVIGDESVLPYDRPPLSKSVLVKGGDASLPLLAGIEDRARLRIDVRLGVRAERVCPGRVELADGTVIHTDAIVVATGSRPYWPTHLRRVEHVRTLRTHVDALAVRNSISAVSSMAVLGGGFIGAEVATAAVDHGLDVHLVEAQPELFAASLGAAVGSELRRRHEDRGVRVTVGRSVVALGGVGELITVLDDGTTLTSDAAVVGFGSVVNADALQDLQEDASQGLRCDSVGRVDGLSGVWAVGDVAAWHDPVLGRTDRREHWSTANEQAVVVAGDIMGASHDGSSAAVPYFWSDQAGTKLQVVGWPELADEGEWIEESVYAYRRAGVLVAAAVIGAPRVLARMRNTIEQTASTPELMRGSSK